MMNDLPKGWAFATINEVNFRKSNSLNPYDFPTEKFEHYSVPIFETGEPEIALGEDILSSKPTVEIDDVLLCKINPRINRVWKVFDFSEHRKICSSEWIIVNTKGNLIPDFLRYRFRAPDFRRLMESEVSGVGGSLTRARPKLVENYPFCVAPFEEQQRIVAKLDELFGHLDVATQKLERIPQMLKDFRQAVLNRAVTGKLVRGEFHELPLGQLLSDIKYGTSKKSTEEPFGTPILRIPNIKEDGIDISDLKYSELDKKEFEKLRLRKEDILIIRSNGSVSLVGQSALVSDGQAGFCYAGYLIRLRTNKKIRPKYLNFVLGSPMVRSQIVEMARSTNGINNINTDEIKSLLIPCPTIEIQDAVVQQIEQLFSLEKRIETTYEILNLKFENLPNSILDKAFRGELVSGNPDEEPASELLKRIKQEIDKRK